MKTRNSFSIARVRRPERTQIEMQMYSLDQMLPADHRARIVWKFVQSLDLTPLYKKIKVAHGQAGQSAIAPEILEYDLVHASSSNAASYSDDSDDTVAATAASKSHQVFGAELVGSEMPPIIRKCVYQLSHPAALANEVFFLFYLFYWYLFFLL